MRNRSLLFTLTLITACLECKGNESEAPPCAATLAELENTSASGKTALAFNNTKYIHRWAKNGQHEFTPPGQRDLSKWTEMLTISIYDRVVDGDSLASVANKTLENYQRFKGLILKTRSVPRTDENPAEHLIVAVFRQPAFLEVTQARFKLVGQKGIAIIHCHRTYGDNAVAEMGEWLKNDGLPMETALMSWEFGRPVPTDLPKVEDE